MTTINLKKSCIGLMLFFISNLAHAQLVVAVDDVFGVPFGQPLVVEALGVLENDTLDGETDVGLTAELVTPVTNGTLICPGATEAPFELCANGSFQYTPGPGFSGTASFTYRALDGTTPSAPATVTLTDCTEVSPQVFSCWLESSYRAKLTELGYSTFLESFEGSAWDSVRSTFDTINSAPEITSQGITWTSNHPLDTTITTGAGPALTGNWGAYDPDHGFATGSPTECDVDTPPPNCLFHDGLSGNVVAGRDSLHGAGGYITGFTGANIAIILDGTTQVNVGALPDAGFHFLGLIDARPPGFTGFEFRELDGKVGQERLIFGDDFTFGPISSGGNISPVANPGGPYTGTAGTPLSFDGSGSTDPDGTIVAYAWDFGDGATGSGPTPSYTYTTAGLYTVSLTVTDNDGASSASATTTASIGTIPDTTPPVITLLGANPVNIEVGSTYTDAGATASDNIDGDITASIVTVSTVNTDLAGIYSVTYNVSDAAGNPAAEVSRTVNVTADIIFGDGFEGNP